MTIDTTTAQIVTANLDIRTAYAADASGLYALPDTVARPHSEDEVLMLLRDAFAAEIPITPAGGQTSTTGASITEGGMLLSLRGLDKIVAFDAPGRVICVQPGVLVGDLKRTAAAEGLLFAPDPTSENECTIGGMIACNASGARTYKYGATRAHVCGLRVALANGEVVQMRRSELKKNTAGYACAHDPIDWFIGSEGTLGVILEAQLALLPLPIAVVGLAIPFATEDDALGFVSTTRKSTTVTPRCIEYFDSLAFAIARGADDRPGWGSDTATMVYVEQEFDDTLDDVLTAWLRLAESHSACDDVRVFSSDAELRHARTLRHAVPATMNERGAQQHAKGGRKVSTDWAVPFRHFAEAIAAARTIADRHGVAPAVIYGHAGNGHPHQNFIAHDADELAAIEQVVEDTLRYVVRVGGTVAAEHGIGKLKRKWLPLQMTASQIAIMRAMKQALDPAHLLAPGNIL